VAHEPRRRQAVPGHLRRRLLIALAGRRRHDRRPPRQAVRALNRSGAQLNAPFAGIGTSGGNFYGPYEPRVSPDGTRIAYWFGQYSSYYSYGCSCYLYHLESKTAWSYADRFTDPTAESEHYLGLEQPEWLTNDRLLAAYPGFWMSGWTFKLGTGTGYSDKAAQWWYQFKDDQGYNYYPTDPALSPDGRKLALTNGGDPTKKSQLLLASVPGPAWVGELPYENDYLGNSAVEQPVLQCWQDKGLVVNPTWSQDSGSVAYGSTDGIHVMAVPADWNCAGLADRLVVPGGSEPDWGPADVNLARKPSPPGAGAANRAKAPAGKAGVGLRKVTLTPATFRARAGAKLRFTLAGPAKLTLTVARASGKKVKGIIRSAGKPGANTLRFKGRIGGRTLRPGRYRLTITARAMAGGASAKATMAFRIVR
jgi:WD40-like Beta Propeller Repeat